MKSNKFTPILLLPLFIFTIMTAMVFGQCEPMGPEECPDPENNGEICPDTLPVGFLNQAYSEVATILVPDTDTTGVALHHLTLASLDNLPTGLSWVSNAPGDEFLAGNYYCILMDGTPTEADTFFLHIVLDVYIDFFGTPLWVMQVTDSTSLSMIIVDNLGLKDGEPRLELTGNYPNPFSGWTTVRFESDRFEEVTFEVYNLLGEKLYDENLMARPGPNTILYDGEKLSQGTYFYVLRSGSASNSRLMVRID